MKQQRLCSLLACCLLASSLFACNKKDTTPPSMPEPVAPAFAKGADVSWVTEMEAAGRKFYTAIGMQQDLFVLLKEIGMNTVRLRVWVDPSASGNWNNPADVVAKALRAKAQGLRLLIDFHYSDNWADPGKQTKPAAWAAQTVDQLAASVSSHTTDVLNALKAAGVTPEWVQVGNETNDGLLWPEGKASVNMANYARFFKAGYSAVKAVFPQCKVVVHVSNGYDNALFRWNLDGLKNNGAQWDVIGMSLYPSASNWPTLNSQCAANLQDMVSRYGSEVMVVEVGMPWDQPTACYNFLSDLQAKVKAVPGNKGLGVLYWEPQAYNNWKGYTLGAFDNSGKPTAALDAFK